MILHIGPIELIIGPGRLHWFFCGREMPPAIISIFSMTNVILYIYDRYINYIYIIWKIEISEFGVVRSPERFSHGPSTQADWTDPSHGSSGSIICDFQWYIFFTQTFFCWENPENAYLEFVNWTSRRPMRRVGPVRLSAGTVGKPLRRSYDTKIWNFNFSHYTNIIYIMIINTHYNICHGNNRDNRSRHFAGTIEPMKPTWSEYELNQTNLNM